MNRIPGIVVLSAAALAACAAPRPPEPSPAPAAFDILLRGGTIADGSGGPHYDADVGIRDGRIVAIGDLGGMRAATELDASGMLVAPGFINLHSHASAGGLPTAENVLTQGITTEILNPDGGGPLDIAHQLDSLEAAGLAVNIGAYAGFNRAWSQVVGPEDRRPTADQIETMRRLVTDNLARGAWGVSAGLDYKPAYYATTAEVVQVLEPAAAWRTNFTNHDRVTPESGFSSHAGMLETIEIGEATGLVPVITHMKVQGREQGGAPEILELMNAATARGTYTAADVYPYLAGQTSLAALIIPGWAQEGGRDAMLSRFRDPEQRARIAAEAEEAMQARFGGAEGVYLPASRRELVDVMRELGLVSAGETVIRLLEEESPTAILRFGSEEDLKRILSHPTASIACDCGATTRASHPRGFGTYPRVLGHYVREQKLMSWEEAIRKMTGLPAATIGMIDRGVLAPGMAADIVVFDSATVIDRATYAEPALLSQGIRHVLVNGRVALRDGRVTGERGGRALRRATWMPSRRMTMDLDRAVSGSGTVAAGATNGAEGAWDVEFDVYQSANAVRAEGSFRLTDRTTGAALVATQLATLQTTGGWAAFTGLARLQPSGEVRAFTAVAERADAFWPGRAPTLTVTVDGLEPIRGALRGQPPAITPPG